MCLWFACFGLHKDDDITYTAPTRSLAALPPPPPPDTGAATNPLHYGRPAPAAQRNGGYYNTGHGHYGNGAQHQTAAADEAGRKASNDTRKGPAAHAVASRDAPLAYAGDAVRQHQPWNGRVAGETGHGHGHGAQAQQQQNYYHYTEREPVHREAAAMDHRYYTTATATADHERY
ncbi:unnamed protein product [Urochloa decumbens]|uniref:Uncharacterized protein n=1 Tax=Urochloa decumbens TaxID=240449 RepID=A0ABC9H3F3_9POAL